MITNEELEKRGYRKHDDDKSMPYSDYFYQKRFSDEKGIKYYVQFVHYPPYTHYDYNAGVILGESWMLELNNNEPHYTFQWHRADSIEQAEAKCETFFRAMGCEFYERNQ